MAARDAIDDLLGAYAAAVQDAERLPFFVAHVQVLPPAQSPGMKLMGRALRGFGQAQGLFSWRPLVLMFVESHVKRQATRLARHARLRSLQVAGDERAALAACDEELRALAERLEAFTGARGSFKAFWPVIAPAIATLLGVESLSEAFFDIALTQVQVVVIAAFFPAIYLGLFCSMAFDRKRKILYPKDGRRPSPLPIVVDPDRDVYVAEDAAFAALNSVKRKEFPLDVLAYSTAAFIFGAVPIGLGIANDDLSVSILVAASFFLLCGLAFPLSARRRHR